MSDSRILSSGYIPPIPNPPYDVQKMYAEAAAAAKAENQVFN